MTSVERATQQIDQAV